MTPASSRLGVVLRDPATRRRCAAHQGPVGLDEPPSMASATRPNPVPGWPEGCPPSSRRANHCCAAAKKTAGEEP